MRSISVSLFCEKGLYMVIDWSDYDSFSSNCENTGKTFSDSDLTITSDNFIFSLKEIPAEDLDGS